MIVITNPCAVKNEAFIINQLFDNGLEVLHLRKPEATIEDLKRLIELIRQEFHSQLSLHQYHEIAINYTINRLHFTEKMRQQPENALLHFNKGKQQIFSTSVHTMDSFNSLHDTFDYAFLSPVYDSISKAGYKAGFDCTAPLKNRTNFTAKLIGLGGIKHENCKRTIDSGFDDVALLGAIWLADDPLKEYKKCKKAINNNHV